MSRSKLNRREFISRSALGITAATLSGAFGGTLFGSAGKVRRPNFILILTDDQGYDDIGVNGNKLIETPNVDAFAAKSVQFHQFIVAPVCAPTRAALLTGRQFLRTGVSHVHGGKDFVNTGETLIPQLLKKAGYATGMWGKWHSGKTSGYFPWQRGFDEAYMAALYKHKDNAGMLNGRQVKHTGWSCATLTDYAIDFMERHKDRPFFAYLPYIACHAPLDAPEKLIEKYQRKGLSKNLSTLYAMLDNFDSQFGRLLEAVDRLGLAENTIVIFTSDNGPAVINDLLTDEDREIRYMNKFKGHKGNMWENGVRVPMFVRWKGKTTAGVVNNLADITDIFPTVLDFAGVELPADNKGLDGRSIKPYILGQTERLPEKNYFDYASPGWPPTGRAWTPEGIKDEYRPVPPEEKHNLKFEEQLLTIRNDRYKLLLNPGKSRGTVEPVDGYVLIDIQNDPLETKNLYLEKPAVAERLKAQLRDFWREVLDEPSSFGVPVFEIGRGRTNLVYAYGPVRIGGNIKNAALFLWGFRQPGDWAEYKIDVSTAGRYRIEAAYDASAIPGGTLQLSVENATTAGTLNGESRASLGILNLQKGRANLKIKVIKPANLAAANLKLKSITFTPEGQAPVQS